MAIQGSIGGTKTAPLTGDRPGVCGSFDGIQKPTNTLNPANDSPNPNEVEFKILQQQDDGVVLGIRLPWIKNGSGVRRLKRLIVSLKIVVISGMASGDSLDSSVETDGADGRTEPAIARQQSGTINFIRLYQKEIKIEPLVCTPGPGLSAGLAVKTAAMLTPREQVVMMGLAEGLLYKEISQRLGISFSAVHKYQHRLFRKLHVSNRSEAIRVWQQVGFK